jgi:ABC-type multidrug transport system, ATPase component
MSEAVLETNGLTKSYGRTKALDNFTVKFEKNRIYGLLGRNGAGKTTLLNIMTSRIFTDSGTVTAFGQNAFENAAILPSICYMPEKDLFAHKMQVRDMLYFAGEFFPNFDKAYAGKLCKLFALDASKRYNALSRGYESILRIVIGLAARAPITIFDEPVLGLDAAVRDDFYKELIDDFSKNPRTFVISTHLIEESADIFEQAIMIKNGRLIEQAPCDTLRENARYVTGKADAVDAAVEGLRVIHTEIVANMKICAVYGGLTQERLRRLTQSGLEISSVPVQKLFIYLTQN